MNHQEAFDKAVTAVIAQGAPSMERVPTPYEDYDGQRVTDTNCLYRKFDVAGNVVAKCGIGHLFSDESYNPAFENHSADTLVDGLDRGDDETFEPNKELEGLDGCFLNALQGAHDSAGDEYEEGGPDFIEHFVRSARRVASDWGLSTEALDKAVAK